MRLKQIDLYRLQIPLRMPIRHSLANHSLSENLVVRVTTDSGLEGYGEGVARQYVTGETVEASVRFLEEYLVPCLRGWQVNGRAALLRELGGLLAAESRATAPAACCALELAILDAAGKSWRHRVAGFFGDSDRPLVYSAVIPMMSPGRFQRYLLLARKLGMGYVKFKVGGERDLECLAQAREVLGEKADIRVDANGAWSAAEAEARIGEMLSYGLSAVEQPVAKDDIEGLKQITERLPLLVVADESLCTEEDAEGLASMAACGCFNLRLSKCGGILAAARIYELGRRRGIALQLGCQVGETSILAAAGRHFAETRELLYLEGSYSGYVLEDDVVEEPLGFGPGGVARSLSGFGLGIEVDQEKLQRLAVEHQTFQL